MTASIRDFNHPYTPYNIQVDLMNALYDCIAEGKTGIFESPTGTGKTLSLICGSLTWLRNVQSETLSSQTTIEEDANEPSWAIEQAQSQQRAAMLEQKLEFEKRLQQIRAKEDRQRQIYEGNQPQAKRRKPNAHPVSSVEDESRFELDEYMSDDDNTKSKPLPSGPGERGLSSTSVEMMEKLGLLFDTSSKNEELDPIDELKIYFCSRTHSQLSQFVQELRHVDSSAASWQGNGVDSDSSPTDKIIKHVPLGSRKHLCINSSVSKLGNVSAINDRCLELQQPDTPKDHKCPFLPNKDNEPLVNDFRDHALAKVRDIEDLGTLGKRIGICPYYASRASIKPSEIVTLPYPLLLQKSSREALGISLKGHVVVVDEAHNLMDTILNLHSISVTHAQLKQCRTQLATYLQKFRNRLKGKNRVYVAQVVRLTDSISLCLDKRAASKEAEGIVEVGDLMTGQGADQINVHKLVHYLQESKLARKVQGYLCHAEEQTNNPNAHVSTKPKVSTMPLLTLVQSFFQTLTNTAAEGRFLFEKDGIDITLKYMLLDPTHHFKDTVEEARAVILAGGTMSPMDDYIRHLFPYIDSDRLTTFSCGHIIPEENLIALPLAKGPGSIEFDFTYEKRKSPAMMEALGNALVDLASAVPAGLVVFFPSYMYLDQVIHCWQKKANSSPQTIWDGLKAQKPIFCESKVSVGEADILGPYTESISEKRGGLLLSVIGGKMSEGINFSDELGRGVVVVGLPFPNITSAQWKAKLEYIEKSTTDRTGSKEEGKVAAREVYENACMRAVNQSIGRAIRHKGDYASIVLIDRRYNTQKIKGKLPGWIREGMVEGNGVRSFQENVDSLKTFFRAKGKT